MEVNIYIGFWTFKMKCTQYGICGQVAFKNARASVIFFQSQTGQAKVFFWYGPKILDFFMGWLPLPVSTSLEKLIW